MTRDGLLHFYVAGREAFPRALVLRSLGRIHYYNPFRHTWCSAWYPGGTFP